MHGSIKKLKMVYFNFFFWCAHLNNNGDDNTVLIIDNLTAHKIYVSKLYPRLKKIPTTKLCEQIPAFKNGDYCGAKSQIQNIVPMVFTEIFDTTVGFEEAIRLIACQRLE